VKGIGNPHNLTSDDMFSKSFNVLLIILIGTIILQMNNVFTIDATEISKYKYYIESKNSSSLTIKDIPCESSSTNDSILETEKQCKVGKVYKILSFQNSRDICFFKQYILITYLTID